MNAAEQQPPEADFTDVLARWNPEGWARVTAIADAAWEPRRIAVIGPHAAGKSALVTELTAHAPGLDLSGPAAQSGLALAVFDSAAPLTADDLRLLDEARVHDCRLVFALNKIDAHQDWAAVRERDATVLRDVLGRAPVIVPVSARLAAVGRALPDPDARARVLAASGIGELARVLTESLPDPVRARTQWRVERTVSAAEETADRIRDMTRALRDGDDVTVSRTHRARLIAGRDGGRAEASAALRSQVQLARVDVVHEVGAQVRALNTNARIRVDEAQPGELHEIPGYLDVAVAELTGRLDAWTRARIDQLARRVPDAGVDGLRGPGGDPPHVGPPPPRGRHTVENRLTVALGASAGVGLGRLAVSPLAMIPALDAATVPLTLVLGGGAAWWFTRSRTQLADRAQLRQWAAEALVEVKAQLEQRMVSALVEAEAVIAERIVRAAAARIAQVDREIEAVDAEIRRLGAQRPGRIASCRRDLAAVEEGLRILGAGISGVEGEPNHDAVRQ
ncbi:hypothetical protein OG921_07600 [Aldersonia sp. NBC_00410]|uniref:hypothetical protein n=1 Tax=Aldersonia sp. NBC_00410 TaxID=2975954 RepID=UPI00225B6088|nr:hypothetical protein [Aldersonia sp. NBC_00410]MCX5043032.1 hypothetical protein [Aldersonia sp. NBC_00410]